MKRAGILSPRHGMNLHYTISQCQELAQSFFPDHPSTAVHRYLAQALVLVWPCPRMRSKAVCALSNDVLEMRKRD